MAASVVPTIGQRHKYQEARSIIASDVSCKASANARHVGQEVDGQQVDPFVARRRVDVLSTKRDCLFNARQYSINVIRSVRYDGAG